MAMVHAKEVINSGKESQNLLFFHQQCVDPLSLRQDLPDLIDAEKILLRQDDLYLVRGVFKHDKIMIIAVLFSDRFIHV